MLLKGPCSNVTSIHRGSFGSWITRIFPSGNFGGVKEGNSDMTHDTSSFSFSPLCSLRLSSVHPDDGGGGQPRWDNSDDHAPLPHQTLYHWHTNSPRTALQHGARQTPEPGGFTRGEIRDQEEAAGQLHVLPSQNKGKNWEGQSTAQRVKIFLIEFTR